MSLKMINFTPINVIQPLNTMGSFWNKHHHGPAVPEEMEENWNMDDEMFVFRKEMTARLLPL